MFKNLRLSNWLKPIINKYKINNFILYFSITLISCLLIKYSIVIPLVSFIFLFIYSLFNWKRKLIIFLIVSVLFISVFINYLLVTINENEEVVNKTFRIYSIKESYVIVTSKFKKYYISIFDLDKEQLILNRRININGQLINVDQMKPRNIYEFDFSSYLNKTGVKYQIKINEVDYLNNGFLYKINKFYAKLFNNELTRIFILNDRTNSEVVKQANSLSLSYLFNFGGLPVFFLSYLLHKVLKLAHLRIKWISISQIVIDSLMLLFCLSINFPFLITKTFLFLLVKNIFAYKRIVINKVKLWIICFTLLIAIHNEVFLNKTFYYYLVAIIFLKQPSTKVIYKRVLYNLVLCSLAFMVVNMIVDYRFYYFNELFDLALIPVFSLEAIFVYLTWWIPKINIVYEFLLKLNISELGFIKKLNLFYSNGHSPMYLYWIYFVSLYLLITNLHNKKVNWILAIILIASLVIIFVYKYIDQSINNKFVLLDVGNGQTLIYHSNKETILFDVGAGKGYSDNKIVSFMKYYGIDKVDKLFISHYHEDHYSALDKLTSNEIKLSEVVKREETNEVIKTKDLVINVFTNNEIDKNENNNSMVYLVSFKDKNLLIMGDLEAKGETKLISDARFSNLLNNRVIDYVVIGHHGSKTSSSAELLELVKPEEAFISGHDDINRHFPDLETINTLECLNIGYKTTEKYGDILFK